MTLLALLAVTSCTSSASESSDALGSAPTESQAGADTGAESVEGVALSPDPLDPTAAETAVGDDPAHGGGEAIADQPEPVVESDDGVSTEPAGGGAELAAPAQTPSAAEVCAVVEFGYLGLLDGDTSQSRLDRLRQGADGALAIDDTRYVDAGNALLAALDSAADTLTAADTLLDICAVEGFERLT